MSANTSPTNGHLFGQPHSTPSQLNSVPFTNHSTPNSFSSGPTSASKSEDPSPVQSNGKTKNGQDGKAKPHICQACHRGFTTGGHLQRHQRIHTGVKAFKCPYPGCETRTSRQDNLQQHYRTHLSPTLRRGSGSAARAAVAAAMEAAGLKSSTSRAPRKSKGSAGGTPSSASAPTSHMPSPYQTPTSQGGTYGQYMYDPQHSYGAYLPPPSVLQSQSANSSRVPSPVNGHSSGHSSVGSMPHQPYFPQGFSPAYGYPGGALHQPYRYAQPGGIHAPYSAGPHPHHGLYSPSLSSDPGQHNNYPLQPGFQHHSREGSFGVLTPSYGSQNPMTNGYPSRTQTSTPLSNSHEDIRLGGDDAYRRGPHRAPSPRRRPSPPEMLGQGVVDPSNVAGRQSMPSMQQYGAYPQPPAPFYGAPLSARDVQPNRASISSVSDNGSGNGGSDGSNAKMMKHA